MTREKPFLWPRRFWILLKEFWESVEDPVLRTYVRNLIQRKGDQLAFVVLFGSRARGDWTVYSDYDVLIGLNFDDGKRFIDRILDYMPEQGTMEVFPYSRSEWERMFRTWHPLLLEALEYGVVLWDRGDFQRMREQFRAWRKQGWLKPVEQGWQFLASPPQDADVTEVV